MLLTGSGNRCSGKTCIKRPGGAIVTGSSIHAEEATALVGGQGDAAVAHALHRHRGQGQGPSYRRQPARRRGHTDAVGQTGREVGIETTNLAGVGRPEDIATAVAFLVSDKAAFMQSAALRMDSGRLDRLQPPTKVHHWPKPIPHAPVLMDKVVETDGGAMQWHTPYRVRTSAPTAEMAAKPAGATRSSPLSARYLLTVPLTKEHLCPDAFLGSPRYAPCNP